MCLYFSKLYGSYSLLIAADLKFSLVSSRRVSVNRCIMMSLVLCMAGQASITSVIAAPTAGNQSKPQAFLASESHDVIPGKGNDAEGPASPSTDAKETPVPVISKSELALLQDLRGRREELDTRENALKAREQLLAAAEERLTERVEQLSKLQKQLETMNKLWQDRNQSNWQSLVKVYEKMRPRDAATIFNDLEDTILMQVLDRMKEDRAAAILGLMQPERARAATAHLAEWRQRTSAEIK